MDLVDFSWRCRGLFTPNISVTLALTLERNTLVSIASLAPSVSISIHTIIKFQMGSGPIQM